jgi:hypothetical protein
VSTTHHHLAPRLKKDRANISTPILGLRGLFEGELYLYILILLKENYKCVLRVNLSMCGFLNEADNTSYQIKRLLVNKELQSEVTSFMLITWILSGWDKKNYEILSSKSPFSDRDLTLR